MPDSVFNKVSGLKKIPAQVFPREFCEIFKNTYYVDHLRTDAYEAI